VSQEAAHIQVEMRSDPRYLCGARELVSQVARRVGFDDLGCARLALAVDEALANVIRHGYQSQTDRPIWISIWPLRDDAGEPTGLKVVIEDEAKHVDVEHIKSRDLDDVRPGGLGVHIIREVMDEARYEKRDGRGMRLTLIKYIDASRGGGKAQEDGNA
jgi:anti-sigma regulatory factor (Ser/Thr protein kinase)